MRTALVIVLICVYPAVSAAQVSNPDAAFEVATIKRSDGKADTAIQRVGNRLVTVNTSLTMLVKWAFDLDDDRLVGGPPDADAVRFDVVAKAPEEAPVPGRMQLMMRTLLADRFALAIHHETRRLTTYTLVKDGNLKVTISPLTDRPGPNPFSMTAPGQLAGKRVTTAMLAKVLASQLGRPVEDMTNLNGVFDFTLEWTPDSADAPIDSTRPSLFTAIREQLGFRLNARQGLVDVVVVDRIDLTPLEN